MELREEGKIEFKFNATILAVWLQGYFLSGIATAKKEANNEFWNLLNLNI